MSITMTGNSDVSEFSGECCLFNMPRTFLQDSVIGTFKYHYRHIEARNLEPRDYLSARWPQVRPVGGLSSSGKYRLAGDMYVIKGPAPGPLIKPSFRNRYGGEYE
jgi:hypothetical protein